MKEFLDLLVKDEDLRERFLAQDSMEDAYSIAKPHLKNVSFEEFQKELTGIAKGISSQEGAISEDELSSVSGGASWAGFKAGIKKYGKQGFGAAKGFVTSDTFAGLLGMGADYIRGRNANKARKGPGAAPSTPMIEEID